MPPKPVRPFPSIITLHRYFMAANRMRALFDQTLADPQFWEKYQGKDLFTTAYLMHADDYGVFMFYWYGGLYVVIEGYYQLHLKDPKIDALLASPNVDLLKRCRNGVFHFQKDYLDDRLLGCMQQDNSVKWVRQLTESFSQFFLREVPAVSSNYDRVDAQFSLKEKRQL
jgi:hypothetical protein